MPAAETFWEQLCPYGLCRIHLVTNVANMDTTRDAKIVALNVGEAIKSAGYNHNSFARVTGIARTTLIRHLEGNDPGFTIPQLAKIAEILGTTADTFYKTPEREVSHV